MSGQPCDCIETVNAKLAEHNAQILLPMFVLGGGPKRPFIETTKLDEKKRGKPPAMFATFCPFCGKPYVEAATPSCEPA